MRDLGGLRQGAQSVPRRSVPWRRARGPLSAASLLDSGVVISAVVVAVVGVLGAADAILRIGLGSAAAPARSIAEPAFAPSTCRLCSPLETLRPAGGGKLSRPKRPRSEAVTRRAKPAAASRLSCATDEGRSLEELLRKQLDAAGHQDACGAYTVIAKIVVGSTRELAKPPFVAELSRGTVVEVLEVSLVEGEKRVRARIKEPQGWISVQNTETGFRWAERSEAVAEFDARLQESRRELREQGLGATEGTGLEVELVDEVRDRLRSDLLYISAVRRQSSQGLPHLPSFEGPAGSNSNNNKNNDNKNNNNRKTWAMCGEGLADWKQMAGACAFEVPLATVTGQLRREMLRAVLAAKTYCGAFLDDYTRQYTQFQGPFAEFFTRFRKAKQQVLISVGGASGLPTSSASKDKGPQATSASSQQSAGGSWTEADLKNWLQFFATISASTRVSQADAYFGHALFGLCLRRIAQRFEIERTLAAAMAGDSEKAPEGEAVEAARFANFVIMITGPGSEETVLKQVLELSSITLGAVRRQVEFLFGEGLRDELARPVDRAKAEIEEEGAAAKAPPLEKHSSFMLEAANSGELRMLSTSLEARDRIMWDAIAFGAFLQDAESEF